MKVKQFFLICVLLTVSVQAFALEILTMGDSITKGWPYVVYNQYGTRRGMYQPELERLLGTANIPSRVYNWGVGGEMTYEGVNRITTVLGSRAADYILIMEGANDVLNGTSSTTTQINIGIMVDKSLQRGVTPIVGTITPNTTKGSLYDNKITNDYNPKLVSMASQKSVLIADQYGALRPEWAQLNNDQLHPNIAGYKMVARTWYLVIHPANPVGGAIMLLLLH
jgi:lysophospholipase L1-like esterase